MPVPWSLAVVLGGEAAGQVAALVLDDGQPGLCEARLDGRLIGTGIRLDVLLDLLEAAEPSRSR